MRRAWLAEALRVLRAGGLLFVETIGEANSWETRAAFDPAFRKPESVLGNLEGERARFERHGVRLTSLASRVEVLCFPDLYEWLAFQCYTWNEPPRERLSPDAVEEYERLLALAGDAQGRISITRHMIWIGA